MLVQVIRATDYKPAADDSPRCFGQLRLRPTLREVESIAKDGSACAKSECGPMVMYFPKGAKPELKPDVAAQFLASGDAIAIDRSPVLFVSRDAIESMEAAP